MSTAVVRRLGGLVTIIQGNTYYMLAHYFFDGYPLVSVQRQTADYTSK